MIERVQSAAAAIGQQQQHSAQSTAPKTGFTELMRQVQDGSPKAPATPQQFPFTAATATQGSALFVRYSPAYFCVTVSPLTASTPAVPRRRTASHSS